MHLTAHLNDLTYGDSNSWIGNGVKALLSFPDELAKLRARPDLMKNAVEEILRYDSPVTNSGRIAHRDLEIDGEKIRRG